MIPARSRPIKRSAKPIKRSRIKRSMKPIPKKNPKRIAKRKIGYRKMLAGKKYQTARAEAMKRAGGQCEFTQEVTVTHTGGPPEGITYDQRCLETLNLHAHHLRYPKTRPVEARDLKIVCLTHHEHYEMLKFHKSRVF